MKEAPENGKESSHSEHANGVNESIIWIITFSSKSCIPNIQLKQSSDSTLKNYKRCGSTLDFRIQDRLWWNGILDI